MVVYWQWWCYAIWNDYPKMIEGWFHAYVDMGSQNQWLQVSDNCFVAERPW